MYAKIIDGRVVQFPYTFADIQRDNPNTSFSANLPDEVLALVNAVRVVVTGAPEYDPTKHTVEQQGCEYVFSRKRWETTWVVRELTPEDIADKASEIRAERNTRLTKCDWTQVLDAQVDRTAWAAYRQELRDITNQPGFPFNIIWPQEP